MTRVKIECETKAPHYDLAIYTPDFKLLRQCPPNSPFDGELAPGSYLLAWRVMGDELTSYKVTFSGVEEPKKPIDRKINKGQVAAADTKPFKVGDTE
jgi:hypothetical protein